MVKYRAVISGNDNLIDLFSDNLEEITDKQLQIEGIIPDWVHGTLVRNGPALFGTHPDAKTSRRYDHIFDGLAKLTSFTVSPNCVSFSEKFLRSKWYEEIVNKRRDIPPSITTGPVYPTFNAFQKVKAAITSSTLFDNVPVNIHKLGGKHWVAITDAPVMLEFDPLSLKTKGRKSYGNSIVSPGGVELFSTAHPHLVTDKSGKHFSYNYFLELKPLGSNVAHMVRTDEQGMRTVVGSVEVGAGEIPYVHDFSMTEKYVILCIWPVRISADAMVTSDRGFLRELQWKGAEMSTKIYVFDKNGTKQGPLYEFDAPPLFAYHHINAFEKENKIIMDVTAYENNAIASGEHAFLYISNVDDKNQRKKQEKDGRWCRFELPLHENSSFPVKIAVKKLKAIGIDGLQYGGELVRINDKYKSKPYRYSYGFTGFAGADEFKGAFNEWALVKIDKHIADIDHEKSISATVWKEANCYPSEPIFVGKPQSDIEDDGVLLSQVYDGARRETFLLVLDATNMTELARCYTGNRSCISFHGQFIPA